jgi:hypothetical protein
MYGGLCLDFGQVFQHHDKFIATQARDHITPAYAVV